MKSCHIVSLSLSHKAALTTRAPCFPVDVPCHEHVPEGKSLWWTPLMNICLWDSKREVGHWKKTSVKDPRYNFSLGQSYHLIQGYISTSAARGWAHTDVFSAKRQNLSLWNPRALLFAGSTEHEPSPSQRQASNKQRPTIGSHWCPWFSLRTKGRKWNINSQKNSSAGKAQRWKTAL